MDDAPSTLRGARPLPLQHSEKNSAPPSSILLMRWHGRTRDRRRTFDLRMQLVSTPLQSIANAQSWRLPCVRFVFPTAIAGSPFGALRQCGRRAL